MDIQDLRIYSDYSHIMAIIFIWYKANICSYLDMNFVGKEDTTAGSSTI